jgi:hypothetical protein
MGDCEQVIGDWVKYFFMAKGKAGREKGENTFSNQRDEALPFSLLPYPFPV